jgi:flagellar hook-basal body complex protein FliE
MAISAPFNAAMAAYGNAAKLVDRAGQGAATGLAAPTGQPDFSKLLAESMDTIAEAGRASDAKTMGLVNGQGNVVDVVTAIAETEIAIESMVTVRDRVISAYEEIMRMPI